jgi:hypothetical protein
MLLVIDHLVGGTQHAVAAGDAGIVDQDRHRPDLFGDAFGDGDAVLALGHVKLEAFCLAAKLANFLRRFFGGFFVHVEQHDLRALAGITERDRAPDPRTCTGDDGDVILEKAGHGCFLSFWF